MSFGSEQHLGGPGVSGPMHHRTAVVALWLLAAALGGCAGPAATGPAPSPPATVTAEPTLVPTTSPTEMSPTETGPISTACATPTTVGDLAVRNEALDRIVECQGDTDIVVTGYLGPLEGIGGVGNGITPSWLGEWSGLIVVLAQQPIPSDGCPEDDGCRWIFLFSPDPSTLPLTPARWVSLTGHLDDPVASTCRGTPGYEGTDGPVSDAEAIAICQRHFVVTDIKTVAAP